MIRKTIGQIIVANAHDLTQSKLALNLDVSRSTIIKYKDDKDTKRHEIRALDFNGNFELMVKVGNKK